MRDVGVVPLEAPDGLQPERAVPDAGLAVARGAGRVPGLSGTPGVALEAPRDSAPAAPEAREPVRVGGVVRPPELVRYVEPRYPPVARAARVEGIVILEATVDERGRVTAVRVLRSIALLERAAIEAVSGWAYEPTLLNGVPVPVLITISVRFTID